MTIMSKPDGGPDMAPAPERETFGLLLGLGGVIAFSLTLPITRHAVTEMTPTMVGLGRAVVAGFAALAILAVTRTPAPPLGDLGRLAVVAAGVVLGFPLLSAWAMQHVPASHGGVMLGILPLATAVVGALMAGERPTRGFWLAGVAGSAAVIVFALLDGAGAIQLADLALLGAVLAAAVGYAEGGRIARGMAAWQVICWALVISLPFLALPVGLEVAKHPMTFSASVWAGFLYLSLISQLGGFLLWYAGLAIGGIARVSQTQLLQPFLTIVAAALLLNEAIHITTIVFAAVVVLTVAISRRMPIHQA